MFRFLSRCLEGLRVGQEFPLFNVCITLAFLIFLCDFYFPKCLFTPGPRHFQTEVYLYISKIPSASTSGALKVIHGVFSALLCKEGWQAGLWLTILCRTSCRRVPALVQACGVG